MLLAGGVQLPGCRHALRPSRAPQSSAIGSPSSYRTRRLICAAKFGGFGFGKDSKDEAARKALEKLGKSMGPGKGNANAQNKPSQPPAKPTAPTSPSTGEGGGGFAGLFSGGGSGGSSGSGGGGWKWGGDAGGSGGSGGGPERPIWDEFKDLMWFIWVGTCNAIGFLLVVDFLHRSLEWFCNFELLLLVGAPAQAFERVLALFYSAVEWVEKNMLGWKLPEEEDMIPMYENIKLWYPEEHAYAFDSYKYSMTEPEKRQLKYYHALRWWERDGGVKGDVTAEDVQRIIDKYEPTLADLRAFRQARANGTLDQYWEERREVLLKLTGSAQPPPLGA